MGQGNVLVRVRALIAGCVGLLGSLSGQGPVYRERWSYLHLENRRLELLQAMLPLDAAVQQRVAEILVEPDGGIPFVPVAKALAHLRGVAADDAFLLRATVSLFVLPEVADPEGKNEVCRQTNVSVHLPFTVPLPQDLAFDLEVRDRTGKQVWNERLASEVTIENLRMARPVGKVPCGDLVDGVYQLHVRTVVDGKVPGVGDPVLQWPLHVMRGYQARSEAAVAAAREAAPKLADLPRTLLAGCSMAVLRAYNGEAFEGTGSGVADLLRLERMLENIAAGNHVLAGITGDVRTALPTGERPLGCVLRLPADFSPDGERTARPLIVFATAMPKYDASGIRPTAPETRGPMWAAMELRHFGVGAAFDTAFLESPGEGRDYASHLLEAITALRQVFRTGDRPIVLVCDREAASVVGLRLDRFRPQVAGLVLVGSAGLTATMLDALGTLPLRLIPLHGLPGGEGLRRSLDYLAARRERGEWQGDVQELAAQPPAWSFGVPLLAGPIAAFATDVFAR